MEHPSTELVSILALREEVDARYNAVIDWAMRKKSGYRRAGRGKILDYQAQREYEELIRWGNQEERIIEELKSAGKFRGGLDGYYPEIEAFKEEYHKCLKKLKDKYGIR